jgi:poly-gamma-glutamate synthesis protein (capsule biosynthesis protein)
MPPTEQQAPTANACTFGAVGDIALAGPTSVELQRRGTSWLFEAVAPVLARADLLFGNLECAVVPTDYPDDQIDPRGLVGKFDGTPALQAAGFDFVSLANNHILDGGTIGLAHTRGLVESRGILAGGVGATQEEARRLQVLERAGLRFGFLTYAEDSNYTLSTTGPGYAYYEPESVLEDIGEARPQVDVLVVSVHADLEFLETPSVPRREAFRRFARAGATLVLGHHPHVPQGVELVGRSLIAYSLGNFVFHAHSSSYLSPHLPNTARTFVLLAEVSRDGVQGFTRVPVLIGRPPDQRPVPADGAEGTAITSYLSRLDGLAADDERVAANWRAAAIRRLESRLRRTASLDDRQAVLHTLASLLHVAENRAWVDEVAAALAEIWESQRRQSDPLHRPSFRLELATSRPRPLPLRVAARLCRAIRSMSPRR